MFLSFSSILQGSSFVRGQIQRSRLKVKENLFLWILILVKYLIIRTGETLNFLFSAPKFGSIVYFLMILVLLPNGHILVDSPSIRRRNSTWKVRRNYIDFERRIHVEIMTSIRRGNFDVDLTFKIDEISMSSLRGFFYVVSTSNRRNFCTRCFHSIIF